MIGVKKIVYDLMRNNAALVTALGNASKIVYMYPQNFNSLPLVTYQEVNQQDTEWAENLPTASESTIQIDVWTGENVSTTAIVTAVDNIFIGELWTRTFSADVPDPDVRIQHRVIRYVKVIKN
jgi:hypothetical protein